MSFIIRIQTSQGMHRLSFSSPSATFGDLQKAIEAKYSITPDAQVLSRSRPNNPDFIENISPTTSLSSMGLKHGSILYLIMVQNQVESFKQSQTKNDEQKSPTSTTSSNPTSKLKPAPNAKKGRKMKARLDDLVNEKDEKEKEAEAGPKHVPFHEYIEERQRKFGKTQPWNIDPPKYNYAPVQMGQQVNFGDLPPNAVVIRQKYRHVDVATFYDTSPFTKFKAEWEKNHNIQRCAYLIGRYELVENKLTKKKTVSTSTQVQNDAGKLQCAKIYALYEPPQKGSGRGVKLLKDNNEKLVDSVVAACGMQRIGIVYTTLPRGGKKYNGDIFMSGQEIFTSARLQEKYKNANTGFSKFVTLICHVGVKEAQCFQISDQGVEMIKNGLIREGTTSLTEPEKDNYGFMQVSVPPPKIYIPGVVNENKEVQQGEHFAPDALLVNVIASAAKKQEHIFNFVHFPSPQRATIDHIRKHLIHHKGAELQVALSDFNLLVYLTKVIDPTLVVKIAKAVVSKQRMDEELVRKIKMQLKVNVPGY